MNKIRKAVWALSEGDKLTEDMGFLGGPLWEDVGHMGKDAESLNS